MLRHVPPPPIPAAGRRQPRRGLVVVEGGPHAIIGTHADQVNNALLDFLRS
jgi:pimeloyl-ACP methyl ester carboxylesterase